MQGARVALWEAGPRSEKMTEKEVCGPSAATEQRWVEAGPEGDPQGIPEGSWREGGACVKVQAVVGAAWGAWVRDAGWVKTEVGLRGQGAEPESWGSEEMVASEGEVTLQTG